MRGWGQYFCCSGSLEVADRSPAGTNEIVRSYREYVVPRSRRCPHLVVLQQVGINEYTQLSAVAEGRDATSGFDTNMYNFVSENCGVLVPA